MTGSYPTQEALSQDPGYVASELRRRILDAFSVDHRITGIQDFHYTVEDDRLTATMTVTTVYGNTPQTVEMNLNA